MSKKDVYGTQGRRPETSSQGFTLMELLVAMVISSIVIAAVYSSYYSQQKSYVVQEEVAVMQQNLRGGLIIMDRDIRMAGYDPGKTGAFGITDITLDADGNWRLQFQVDLDEDSSVDGDETITYSLIDEGTDGDLDLARDDGGGAQLLAENIEWLGLAYAYDYDGGTPDGELDFDDSDGDGQRDANEPVIWAVDTDGDNQLDRDLDTNGDGVIDENDDDDENGFIDDKVLASPIPITAIRAVKIWVLARTDRSMRGYTDTNTYVVGDMVLTPGGSYRRRILTTNVRCRNLSQ